MKKGVMISIIVLSFLLVIAIVYIFYLSDENKILSKCSSNGDELSKNKCLTDLAIKEDNSKICNEVSEENKSRDVCNYQYNIKNKNKPKQNSIGNEAEKELENCYQTGYCSGLSYYDIAKKYNLNSEICNKISNPKIKAECNVYLGGYSEEELKQVLFKNDLNLDINARIFALKGLTGFSCENIEFLLQMTGDKDSLMRFKAIQYIGDNNCYLANLALNEEGAIDKIREVYYQEQDLYVQAQIIHTLGKIGNEKVIPFIQELLDSNGEFIQIASFTALGYIGGDKSISILNKYIDSQNALIRINARAAINRATDCENKGTTCIPLKPNEYNDINSCPPDQSKDYCISSVAQNTDNLDLCYKAGELKDSCIMQIAKQRRNSTLCYQAGEYKDECLRWCGMTSIPYEGAPSETMCNP